MAKQQPHATDTERGGGVDVIALLHREHFAAHDASIYHPSGRRKAEDDVAQSESNDGVDGQREEDEWERELDVGDAHHHRRRPALDEAGEQPEHAAHDAGHDDGTDADEEGQARAVENTREQVASELIRSERMSGRAGRLQARREIGEQGIVRGDPRRSRRRDDVGERHAEPEPGFQL